jgi:hypothetical protein
MAMRTTSWAADVMGRMVVEVPDNKQRSTVIGVVVMAVT